MSKYFRENEETEKLKLSEYLKSKEFDEKYSYLAKYKESRTKYIMEIIGDIELSQKIYETFLHQFMRGGGRYCVRTTKETIKGMYDIHQKYPFLTYYALDEIWERYIYDQFEEYKLDELLGIYIKLYGKTDECFEKFIRFVDKTAKEVDKRFVEEEEKVKQYFSDQCIISSVKEYLIYMIKKQHITADKIIDNFPSEKLILKDEEQLKDLIASTRIYFGACNPISYQLIGALARGEEIDSFPEQPQYVICGTKKVDATFTKQEFLDSIQKNRVKKLEKK